MNKNEIWMPIKNYENYYVSNLGNVMVIKNVAIRINSKIKGIKFLQLKQSIDIGGYSTITLTNNGFSKTFKIHRLVAEAFIKNPKQLQQINHKDENKQNNSVNNLEWCSSSYNNNYGNRNIKVAKKLKKKVDCLDMNGNLVKTYESVSATRKDDFLPNKVCQVCKNKYGRKTHKGYLWKYHSSEETSY